ncbi:MAG: hypothetical protein K9L68_00140 [Spirochaetales bacterium]|nr:hypothetical protein [Spirochaetales bacterium]MCF7936987.1 hypothetical protein [Spirochaetales bacterium]
MGRIKSALEIALERTESINGDPEALRAHEVKQVGKKIASKLINDTETSEKEIKETFKEYKGKELSWLKDSFFDTLMTYLQLPTSEDQLERLGSLETGFSYLFTNKGAIKQIFPQLRQLFEQYLQNREQLKQQLAQQYQGKLKQKEEQIARQTGSQIKLDPEQDPEFASALHHHQSQLEGQYNQVVEQIKDELKNMYGNGG